MRISNCNNRVQHRTLTIRECRKNFIAWGALNEFPWTDKLHSISLEDTSFIVDPPRCHHVKHPKCLFFGENVVCGARIACRSWIISVWTNRLWNAGWSAIRGGRCNHNFCITRNINLLLIRERFVRWITAAAQYHLPVRRQSRYEYQNYDHGVEIRHDLRRK